MSAGAQESNVSWSLAQVVVVSKVLVMEVQRWTMEVEAEVVVE